MLSYGEYYLKNEIPVDVLEQANLISSYSAYDRRSNSKGMSQAKSSINYRVSHTMIIETHKKKQRREHCATTDDYRKIYLLISGPERIKTCLRWSSVTQKYI